MTGGNDARIVPPPEFPDTYGEGVTRIACLLRFDLESGSGHAIDLEPTHVFP
jgi:hypothetical protein